MEDNEEEDDDNYPVFSEHGRTTMEEDEAEHEVIVDDQSDEDLRRVILDEQINCGSENERSKLERMLDSDMISRQFKRTYSRTQVSS